MGLAVGMVVGALDIATIRSLSPSALGGFLLKKKLVVLKLLGTLSLMPGVTIVSVLPTCMGAGVRSIWMGMASFA